jgi:hypothetical protein
MRQSTNHQNLLDCRTSEQWRVYVAVTMAACGTPLVVPRPGRRADAVRIRKVIAPATTRLQLVAPYWRSELVQDTQTINRV